MKDIDEAARLTIEIAKLLITAMQSMDKPWRKAFLRMEFGEGYLQCKGTYVQADGVEFIRVAQHRPMFSAVEEIAPSFRDAHAKGDRKPCVALVIVDSQFNYEILYEYDDPTRWAISKMDGASGIPIGIEA